MELIDSIEDADLVEILIRIAQNKSDASEPGGIIDNLPEVVKSELYQSYNDSFNEEELLSWNEIKENMRKWNEKSA